MVCGAGKTITTAHILRSLDQRVHLPGIVVLAELRALVLQLHGVLNGPLANRRVLVVSVDGTTDADVVRTFVAQPGKWMIFSTYTSAVDVLELALGAAPLDRCLVVVDEVHIAAGDDDLCAFIRAFGRGILLTATVPGDLEDSLHFGRPYALRLPEAIRRGIVCDYDLYLPLIEELNADRSYVDVPLQALPVDTLKIVQAMYVQAAMLRTGAACAASRYQPARRVTGPYLTVSTVQTYAHCSNEHAHGRDRRPREHAAKRQV